MWKNIVEKIRVADDHEHGYETDKWINPDIAPLPPSRRNWGIWAYLAWTGAASLLSLGLTVPQTIGLMVIARILMVALIIGNGWIGGEWHIGFAVHQRMILGMRGAYITQAMRIMLFIVWYGSQAWLGGLCVSAMISSWSSSFLNMENTFAASANMVTRDFIGFLLFHLISVPFLLIRPENSKPYVITANVIVLIVMLAITIWAGVNGGTGPLFVSGARQPGVLSTGWAWVYGIISNLGVISAGIVNQSDFTRFARRQGLQVPGMAFSLLVPGMIVPIFAIITASASMSI
ncbi:Putative serine/threonine-protein kinase [Verticillium dahliae VDG2]|nr:Putative serine/threonine-protein kinase [Verticillium dahliae VDG2]